LKEYVGKRVKRKEDYRFVTGTGQYVADIKLADMAEATFVRSTHAHAKIESVDVSEALAMKGVYAVLTGEDLEGIVKPLTEAESHCYLPPIIVEEINPVSKSNLEYVLAKDRVVYVGQPIAVVVAENRYLAEDAASLIKIQYASLPVVVDPYEALKEGASLIQDHLDSNLQAHFQLHVGDCEEALLQADHVIREVLKSPRVASNPIETRGVVAHYDNRSDQLHIWTSTQLPYEVRHYVGKSLGMREENIRVTAPDVGGGFGPKGGVYPEEVVIGYLAKLLMKPVKWIEDRLEHMSASRHSRDQIHDVEVFFKNDGTILGIKDEFLLDVGAINYFAFTCAYNSVAHFRGPYKVPNFYVNCKVVLTNKTPNVPYRGAGRPEVVFTMDRIIDIVAKELNMDPVLVMHKNMIKAEEMPYDQGMYYKDGGKLIYDSGDYPAALKMALELSGYEEIRKKQNEWREQGKYIGIGISSNVEGTGVGPFEGASISINQSGQVLVHVGSTPQGQSHETVFAQICADELGVDFEDVKVKAGDTSLLQYGAGTYASRSAVNAGSAIHGAALKVKSKLFGLAQMMGLEEQDLELKGGCVCSISQPENKLTLKELAAAAAPGPRCKMPDGLEPGLQATYYFVPPTVTYSSSTHAAVVEVDIETCQVSIQDYVIVHDSGKVINPMIVEGQIQGGLAQGIGTALYEEVVHNEQGQVLTGTYMDYLLPTSMEIPTAKQGEQEFLSTRNPLGIKGVGESGTISPPAALANAVVDALSHLKITITQLPISPERLFRLIQDAKKSI
jgi:aerobic carbon-monoxide dehydrogenase large subunit